MSLAQWKSKGLKLLSQCDPVVSQLVRTLSTVLAVIMALVSSHQQHMQIPFTSQFAFGRKMSPDLISNASVTADIVHCFIRFLAIWGFC